VGEAVAQIAHTKKRGMRFNANACQFLTHGGCAYGIPKNWETLPEAVPVKVPLSRVTVGSATASPTIWVAIMRKAGSRFIVKCTGASHNSAPYNRMPTFQAREDNVSISVQNASGVTSYDCRSACM